ncbi:hypothetical protein ABBQ32_007069 [Trebouxia sp. C0010 RCD-2024]
MELLAPADPMRWHLIAVCAGTMALFVLVYVPGPDRRVFPGRFPLKHAGGHARESFTAIASRLGTDKVGSHSYQHFYETHLQPLRDRNIRLMEIGLGCLMSYGPGVSFQVWREFLPQAKLIYLEYDEICANEWRPKIESAGATLYTGDQSNKTLLQQIVLLEGENGLDVIIDDGGHTMQQQLTSLQVLWEIIRPGGFYVVEDLITSYSHDYGGGPPGAPSTTISYVKSLLDFLICQDADDAHQPLPFCEDKRLAVAR